MLKGHPGFHLICQWDHFHQEDLLGGARGSRNMLALARSKVFTFITELIGEFYYQILVHFHTCPHYRVRRIPETRGGASKARVTLYSMD